MIFANWRSQQFEHDQNKFFDRDGYCMRKTAIAETNWIERKSCKLHRVDERTFCDGQQNLLILSFSFGHREERLKLSAKPTEFLSGNCWKYWFKASIEVFITHRREAIAPWTMRYMFLDEGRNAEMNIFAKDHKAEVKTKTDLLQYL